MTKVFYITSKVFDLSVKFINLKEVGNQKIERTNIALAKLHETRRKTDQQFIELLGDFTLTIEQVRELLEEVKKLTKEVAKFRRDIDKKGDRRPSKAQQQ